MQVVLFTHSLLSDWNNGHAHFLRGVVSELCARGITVTTYEPRQSWSAQNLVAAHGEGSLREVNRRYPQLQVVRYDPQTLDLAHALDGADLVLVHEWNDPALVARIGGLRAGGARFTLFFHDTHHRSVTAPRELERYDLSGYDGVLAFGQSVQRIYEKAGWARRAFVWHLAADTAVFRPLPAAGFTLEGWVPNWRVPETYAAHRVTVHVPRRPYALALPGVPTIRPFEALACGIPMVSAPWDDAEHLFSPGIDYLIARNSAQMQRRVRDILHDPDLAAVLSARGPGSSPPATRAPTASTSSSRSCGWSARPWQR